MIPHKPTEITVRNYTDNKMRKRVTDASQNVQKGEVLYPVNGSVS